MLPLAPVFPLTYATGHRGFTIVELMVTIAVLGVLAALALPSFTPLIERWRVHLPTEELKNAMYYARSEAMKRGGRVVIQKLASNTSGCTASGTDNWNCGWYICVDSNDNGACTTSEPLLQRYEAPASVEITRSTGGASIAFNRWGLVAGKYPGFSIIPRGKNTSNPAALGVCMSSAGRVRIIPSQEIPCNG